MTVFISEMKVKAGIYNGPQVRELAKDEELVTVKNDTEESASNVFKSVVSNVLEKHKTTDYECVISELIHY